jgi:aminoglycoside phosphotransferase (APT) family kinase protein
MAREYRVISALAGSDVPVAPAVALCEDESVNGAPFYVMGFVEGLVVRECAAGERFDEGQRAAIGRQVADTLTALHAVDPDAVGLGQLGRQEGYVARQLRRWHGQWEQSKTRELAAIDEVHDRLAGRIPEQGPATIVHGDYRLDNMILTPDGRIAAVVDWELCTLGDPLADVGLLMVYWAEPKDEVVALMDAATTLPGFPSREQLLQRYAERSGRDLARLDFYVAFGCFKLAVVLEGIHARFLQNATVGEGFDQLGVSVPVLIERAHRVLDTRSPW